MNQLVVHIKQGQLVGKENYSNFHRRRYYSFYGIPYGKPPLNALRFLPPEPAESWDGILDATVERSECAQHYPVARTMGSEDCLYINIHTTDLPSKNVAPKPVLVNIHPSAFTLGSSHEGFAGTSSYIISPDVIYVTFNYRLNVLGFLNFMIPECPGNAGIKDVILALRWIKENISYFGGDPHDITAIGSSSGGSIINLLLSVEQTKGLINKAIIQGLHCLCCNAFSRNPIEDAFRFARIIGYTGDDPQEAVRILKELPVEKLIRGVGDLRQQQSQKASARLEYIQYRPSVEIDIEGAFLTQEPFKLIPNISSVPLLFLVCDRDGMYMFIGDPWIKLNNNFEEVIKVNTPHYDINDSELNEIAKRVRNFYYKDAIELNAEESLDETINLFTDMWNFEQYSGLIENILKNSPKTPVYITQFTYVGERNVGKNAIKLKSKLLHNVSGACHSDEIAYYCTFGLLKKPNSKDSKIMKRLCLFYNNFAKTGNPNLGTTDDIVWKPSTIEQPCYLEFGTQMKMVKGKMHHERTTFWEDLLKPYRDRYTGKC